ncbi:MAG: type II toxin-antitoxin system PemK/MazF family toxin [Clostridia bacterium]|nr:type II toxin-antitoxin system PemK/MazF family toxin [Clostridia bacterium]
MVKVFEQGDIIYINFNPQSGHEQSGRRPAVVISNNTYNRFSKMLMLCPITNTNKNHPFHIELDGRTKTTGVILCERAKMLDVYARNAEFAEKLPDDILSEIVDMVYSFIEIL